MQRNTIGLVWLAGTLLALGVYVIGPDRFLQVSFGLLDDLQAAMQAIMAAFTVKAFELIRALAIGLFVVFLGLGIIAASRGLRARAALVVVGILYLVLLSPAVDGGYVASSRWLGAFLLAAVGSLVMTRRLLGSAALPAPNGDPWAARRP